MMIRLTLLGDLFYSEEIACRHSESENTGSIFKAISPYIEESDILFVNLEGPLEKRDYKRSDVTSHLSNSPKVLDLFKNFSVCVVNIGNNHIMDYGPESLKKTVETLKRSNVFVLGAGGTITDANKEIVLDVKGKKLGFLSFTSDVGYVGSVIATNNSAGCASYSDNDAAIQRVKEFKSRGIDTLCVSLHWGHEYFFYPSEMQVRLAHQLVDAGANMIIGHHPHVIQGVEQYKNALIIYSLGNFFFSPYKSSTGRKKYLKKVTKNFMLLNTEISQDDAVNMSPVWGKIGKKHLIKVFSDKKQVKANKRLDSLSQKIKDRNYNVFWNKYKIKRTKELKKEVIIEAILKLKNMSLKEILKTVSFRDIKRNFSRIISYIFKTK